MIVINCLIILFCLVSGISPQSRTGKYVAIPYRVKKRTTSTSRCSGSSRTPSQGAASGAVVCSGATLCCSVAYVQPWCTEVLL